MDILRNDNWNVNKLSFEYIPVWIKDSGEGTV